MLVFAAAFSIPLAGSAGDAVPAVSIIQTQLLFAAPSRAAVSPGEEQLIKLTSAWRCIAGVAGESNGEDGGTQARES